MSTKMVKVMINDQKNIFAKIDEKDNYDIKNNIFVIVSLDKNVFFGKVIDDTIEVDKSKLGNKIYKIERVATKEDINKNQKNILDEEKAVKNAQKISKELDLDMRIINARFTFDRTQLYISFISEERVDFRELAKRLASIYKTRIELRQIGVRDKAKEVGGLGPCGRFLCCNLFLNDFESVSINMAKNQFISLKPDKINGICGRLLCCLKYEDEQYSEMKKEYPKMNSTVKIDNEEGKVVAINVLKKTVMLEKSDKSLVTVDINKNESSK